MKDAQVENSNNKKKLFYKIISKPWLLFVSHVHHHVPCTTYNTYCFEMFEREEKIFSR